MNLSHVAHENVTADRRRAVKEEPWRLEEMKVMRYGSGGTERTITYFNTK